MLVLLPLSEPSVQMRSGCCEDQVASPSSVPYPSRRLSARERSLCSLWMPKTNPNSDKLVTSRCRLNRDLISNPSMSPVCQCGKKLWPTGTLLRRRSPSSTGPGRLSRLSYCKSPRPPTSASACQRWHEVGLNKGRVVALCPKINIQAHHELCNCINR